MHVVDEQLMTVTEVAEYLRVAPSTVRRWVRDGAIPAFRIGRRRVGIRRSDLGAVVESIADSPKPYQAAPAYRHRKLSPDEKARALAVLDDLDRLRAEMVLERDGKPFLPAWELVDEIRDERAEQLP